MIIDSGSKKKSRKLTKRAMSTPDLPKLAPESIEEKEETEDENIKEEEEEEGEEKVIKKRKKTKFEREFLTGEDWCKKSSGYGSSAWKEDGLYLIIPQSPPLPIVPLFFPSMGKLDFRFFGLRVLVLDHA